MSIVNTVQLNIVNTVQLSIVNTVRFSVVSDNRAVGHGWMLASKDRRKRRWKQRGLGMKKTEKEEEDGNKED